MLKFIKAVSAITLLLCLFLPLSQCTQKANSSDEVSTDKTTVFIALKDASKFNIRPKSAVPAFVMILPFVLLLLQALRHDIDNRLGETSVNFSWSWYLLEFSSVICMLFLLGLHAMAQPMYGLYIALVSTVLYFLCATIPVFKRAEK